MKNLLFFLVIFLSVNAIAYDFREANLYCVLSGEKKILDVDIVGLDFKILMSFKTVSLKNTEKIITIKDFHIQKSQYGNVNDKKSPFNNIQIENYLTNNFKVSKSIKTKTSIDWDRFFDGPRLKTLSRISYSVGMKLSKKKLAQDILSELGNEVVNVNTSVNKSFKLKNRTNQSAQKIQVNQVINSKHDGSWYEIQFNCKQAN